MPRPSVTPKLRSASPAPWIFEPFGAPSCSSRSISLGTPSASTSATSISPYSTSPRSDIAVPPPVISPTLAACSSASSGSSNSSWRCSGCSRAFNVTVTCSAGSVMGAFLKEVPPIVEPSPCSAALAVKAAKHGSALQEFPPLTVIRSPSGWRRPSPATCCRRRRIRPARGRARAAFVVGHHAFAELGMVTSAPSLTGGASIEAWPITGWRPSRPVARPAPSGGLRAAARAESRAGSATAGCSCPGHGCGAIRHSSAPASGARG